MKKYLFATALSLLFAGTGRTQILQQVKDLNTTGNSYPWQLTVAGDKLFFAATDESSRYKLWVTDGTDAGTAKLGPAANVNTSIEYVTAFKNKVYFVCTGSNNNYELWVSDGTEAGTQMLIDIYPGETGSFPSCLTVANDKLFFLADNTDGSKRLYVSDGTAAGTTVLRNAFTEAFNGASRFVVFQNNILFTGDNGSGSGYGLWKSDGTLGGTVLVKADVRAGVTGAPYGAELNGKFYLCVSDNVSGNELWVTDGTEAGTNLVKNISPGDGGGVYANGNPQAFITFNNKVYFSATDGTHGQELWSTDGTESGTQMVKDIVSGTDGSLPYQNIVFNGNLYFISWQTQELWVSDGSEAGTQSVKAVPDASAFAATWNGKMYLISGSFNSIYQSDGTSAGTIPIKVTNTINAIVRGFQFGTDRYFLEYKGDLYLQAANSDVTNGFELARLTFGALPLQLVSFAGERRGDLDVLTWKTVNEVNTSLFIVEQSADGQLFSPCGTVAAAGNSNSEKTYSFTQRTSLNRAGYYRLKMVDKDGQFRYSITIRLQGSLPPASATYNASTKQVTIVNAPENRCQWQVVNSEGKPVKKGSSAGAAITVHVGDLSAGIYYFQYASVRQNRTLVISVF